MISCYHLPRQPDRRIDRSIHLMTHRARGAFALHLLLALTSLLPTAGHELLCVLESQAPPGVGDRSAGSESSAPSLASASAQARPLHEDDGHCCPFCFQQVLLGPTLTSSHLRAAIPAPVVHDAGSVVRQRHASHTSRGPPAS